MKKIFTIIVIAVMALMLPVVALSETDATASIIELEMGAVQIYDFGDNRLHAYISGDALGDACYAVESAEGIVLIESTAFADHNAEWKAYVDSLGKDIAGKLMAYHPNGSDDYSEDMPYATENALANWGEGGSIRALTDGFVAAYDDTVAADHPADAQIVNFGDTVTLAGLDFVIRDEGDDAYGIEIPAINCIYIHMMGSNTHNILTSVDHIDAFMVELKSCDYDLVLSGHNAPEGREAVQEKIAYLEKVRELAESCENAVSFTEAMNKAFPDYAGVNYLEMTAGYLFPAAE